jgi:hypothetical protein
LVTSGSGPQSIVVTGNTFFSQALSVYSVYGLGTNSPQNTVTGGTSVSIGVNAGDFLFAISEAQDTAGWGGSTQAPAKTYSDTNQGPSLFLNGADWTIASTNASFSVSGLATSGSLVAANWR